MSVVNTGAARRSSGAGSAIFANVFAALNNWNDRRLTRSSLSRLSDRQLEDIGLCRGDIENFSGPSIGR
ncbi:MAG: DUF1127 domain-containing protein [Marinovum sp.]|nr:DUF1127 domain-containing protein [Marinovum sp.]MDG1425215.1 DUF1127 domain-containing protein [Paracoccaceae bacterium]MBT4873061.1 DUF1127 domain-containing protein [Marinovum sp.]MBT6099770.1 DUF1127 domain-containing protein [Marinovum sp.]MBT6506779.1 DUF1127 domain-containing protein [Marinovum sp.]